MSRQFTCEKAERSAVPLLVGLMGPSGGGKTYSALRLAEGIRRVFPGDIIGIDTESNRMKHYSDNFDFHHIPFTPPFGSLDYLDVLQFAATKKPSVIIVDSMSHEHEGPGGLLDLHDQETERMAGGDFQKKQRVQMLAWQKPKADRRKLINALLQMNCNFIFCFRAKETSKPVKKNGKTEIESMGFMPIAGDEFVFEMTVNMLLLPHADGRPSWQTENRGEKIMMKLPAQFRDVFKDSSIQLTEEIGEKLAKWAKGDAGKVTTCPELKQLEDYLQTGKVKNMVVTLGGQDVNLIEKTKSCCEYIKTELSKTGKFDKSCKGYSQYKLMLNEIEKREER